MADAPTIDPCWNRRGVWGTGDCPELSTHAHCRDCPTYSDAAAQLLDRDLPAAYRQEWTAHFARPKPVEELQTESLTLFRLGAEWLALPTGVLNEVAELRAIHSLPHRRDRVVLGVVNIRGELLVCVCLEAVLGLESADPSVPAAPRATRRLLVVNAAEGRLVFPVDEVHGIHRCGPGEIGPAPATVARAAGTYTRGVLRWRERSVGLLDDRRLFATLNRSLS